MTRAADKQQATRAVIYDRVSVDDKDSQAEHVARCRAYCEAKGWQVVGQPITDVVSGFKRDVRRSGWDKVQKMIEREEVDAVVVYSVSRAGRNLAAFTAFLQTCRDHKVVFAAVTEDLSTAGQFGPLIYALLGGVAEMESLAKSERALMGREVNDREGRWSGGYRPFGFDLKRLHPDDPENTQTRLAVNAAEAKLIRKAASDVLAGVSLSAVARRWNERGVRTSGGKRWSKGHVRALLSAERNVPDVLTASDREALLKVFDGRRQGGARDRYLLSGGLLTCARCGGMMHGRAGRYICSASGEVHLSAVASNVDRTVTDALDDAPDRKVPEVRDPSEPLVRQREEKVREQEALGESGLSVAAIRGADRRLQREIDALDKQIEQSRPEGSFAKLYREGEEFDERAFLEGLIERVVLYPGGSTNRWDAERVVIEWR